MNYQKFQELCDACCVSREDVEECYGVDPHKPWSSGLEDYTEDNRESDAVAFLNDVFGADGELDLTQLSSRIAAYRKRLQNEKIAGGVWATIGNVRTAVAKAAAKAFVTYVELLPDQYHLDLEEIRLKGKPSPYGNMHTPDFLRKPDGRLAIDGERHADHEAAGMMYGGDYLALLIAREYGIEDCMP